MEKERINIEWIEYKFIAILSKRKSWHTTVSLYKNWTYYRTYKHIWLWMLHYKKHIPKWYVLHHINKNETDDRIENLQLVTRWEHNRLHADDINHYMFRKWHSYRSHPKSEQHKERIKQSHIDRAERRKSILRDIVYDYIINHKDCTPKDVIKYSGWTQAWHFSRRFWIKFLDFKNKILNGERKKWD